jgi:hypothetical protein
MLGGGATSPVPCPVSSREMVVRPGEEFSLLHLIKGGGLFVGALALHDKATDFVCADCQGLLHLQWPSQQPGDQPPPRRTNNSVMALFWPVWELYWSQPKLGANRIALNATKQAPAPFLDFYLRTQYSSTYGRPITYLMA